jgi:L-lactate dehydrogenase complex protein LldG
LPFPEESNPVFKKVQTALEDCFKNELESVSGLCTLCESDDVRVSSLKNFLDQNGIKTVFSRNNEITTLLTKSNISCTDKMSDFVEMEAGITDCEFLVARTGSIVVSSQSEAGRQMIPYPPIHIVFADKSQIVETVEEALVKIQEKYKGKLLPSMVSFVSGPSRTADIEKTLVLGAHGPKKLHVFIRV